ncbi:TAXI family TRAP transporter solute-binding subunit [Lipingzhangella sp. LS1_29]|uniref:TAXI family TRAP transporter solute-binding subunit n=1 Tax=Lipingzhangella rawalii TaxID=2055835 RepID=A0ABU2H5K1_9ACTN|nr:TAXI family TRAP transporter solute-binding subunit [Lipingzhangella rawalii]MDS1270583.1 TAXI family TRAP transporter solute-binding subunit [Lipingzhangella rawalii]
MPTTCGPRAAAVAAPLTLVLLAACTQPADTVDPDERDSLSIATGGSAGVYYPVGGALAEIIGDEVSDLSASVESTGASVENMRLIESGDSDLAIVQGDAAYQALHGEGEEFDGDPIEARALTVLYPNVYHTVTLESINDDLGMECFSDVEGTRFSFGAPGSGNELATQLIFDGVGLDRADVDEQNLGYAETANALREDQLDAGSWSVGEGHASLQELETTDPIELISMCADERDSIVDEHPFYAPHTIEAGVYETVDEDVETMALWNVLVVAEDFPDELAEQIVTAFYEHSEVAVQTYEPGEPYFTPETMLESPIPLHSGAIGYAEDHDLDVPDELRP